MNPSPDPYATPSPPGEPPPAKPDSVSPRKRSLARIGLATGFVVALLGAFAACDCRGFAMLSVVFAAAPLMWGTRLMRIAALALVIGDVASVWL